MKKNIGIFIDHDIIIRNFINTKIFEKLNSSFNLIFFFPENYKKRVTTNIYKLDLKKIVTIDIDHKRSHRLQRFYHVSILKSLRKRTDKDKKVTLIMYKHILRKGRFYLDWIKSSKFIFPFYEKFIKKKIGPNLDLIQKMKNNSLDLVIHPTVLNGLFVNDLLDLCKQMHIPNIFLINSWDNPSTKSLMYGFPDKLFVWGEQTMSHAIKFLNIPRSNIVISGAAQFEIYKNSHKIDTTSYRKLISNNINEKIVCYAGSSKGLNEMIHLKVLDDFISNENSLIKILYKPHPWKDKHKDEKNFFEYNFKNIIMDPFSIDNYEAIFKNKYFNLDLINQNNNIIVLKSIDALITPVSTILLEAAFLGKPIAVYLSNDNLDLKSHFNIASQRIQYTEFYSLIEPLLCESMDDIWPTIKKLLKLSDDMNYCNELKNKIQKCNFFNELPYSDLLENTINELTNEKK